MEREYLESHMAIGQGSGKFLFCLFSDVDTTNMYEWWPGTTNQSVSSSD
jgi:hypothetical protein